MKRYAHLIKLELIKPGSLLINIFLDLVELSKKVI